MRGSGPLPLHSCVCCKRSEFLARCKRRISHDASLLFGRWCCGGCEKERDDFYDFARPRRAFALFLRLEETYNHSQSGCVYTCAPHLKIHTLAADALTTEDLLCEPKGCCCEISWQTMAYRPVAPTGLAQK